MFENVFGIHEQALLLQGQRVGILATNLANADTPNYKARDIDFSAVLSGSDAAPLPLSVTDGAHIMLNDAATPSADLKFRNPYQASHNSINGAINNIDQALNQSSNVRATIGGRLNAITTQQSVATVAQTQLSSQSPICRGWITPKRLPVLISKTPRLAQRCRPSR
jgi:flagellar basal-body rod protein FlgB